MPGLDDLESNFREIGSDSAESLVINVGRVVTQDPRSPEKLDDVSRRRGPHDEPASGAKEPPRFPIDCFRVVRVEVLDEICGNDEIRRSGPERGLPRVGLEKDQVRILARIAPGGADPKALAGEVDSHDEVGVPGECE